MKKDFSKIALQTSLFKGQSTLLYVYLKAEKLAHVLFILQQKNSIPSPLFDTTTTQASAVPALVANVAAGELNENKVLAEIFAILTSLRLLATKGELGSENVAVLTSEYEYLLERLGERGTQTGPVFSSADLLVAEPFAETSTSLLPSHMSALNISVKDTYKGHAKSHYSPRSLLPRESQSSSDRTAKILEIIRGHQGISIKGISSIIRDCSEKTIQRELGTLIDKGLVIREGERRWSIYKESSNPIQSA